MQALTPILINMLFPRSGNTQAQAQTGENGQVSDEYGAGATHSHHHHRSRLQQQSHRRHHSTDAAHLAAAHAPNHNHRLQSSASLDEKRGLGGRPQHKAKRFSLDDSCTFQNQSYSEKPRLNAQQQPSLARGNIHDRVMTNITTIDDNNNNSSNLMDDTTASTSSHLRRRGSADKSKNSQHLLIDLA